MRDFVFPARPDAVPDLDQLFPYITTQTYIRWPTATYKIAIAKEVADKKNALFHLGVCVFTIWCFCIWLLSRSCSAYFDCVCTMTCLCVNIQRAHANNSNSLNYRRALCSHVPGHVFTVEQVAAWRIRTDHIGGVPFGATASVQSANPDAPVKRMVSTHAKQSHTNTRGIRTLVPQTQNLSHIGPEMQSIVHQTNNFVVLLLYYTVQWAPKTNRTDSIWWTLAAFAGIHV